MWNIYVCIYTFNNTLQEFADKFMCHLRMHGFNEKDYISSVKQSQC